MRKPKKMKVGLAPTRRNVFSVEDSLKYKALIEKQLRAWKVPFVNLDSINKEGLLLERTDVPKVLDLFRREQVDCLFIPHVNFGTEHAVATLARDLGKPTLLWGPRDEAPLPDGGRLRDTQCGLFATSKILRRMGVPFSYIINSRLEEPVFERGFRNFLAAASAANAFRGARIGQVSTRPGDFWTMIVNEGELLERWGIEVVPTTLSEVLTAAQAKIDNRGAVVKREVARIRKEFECGEAKPGLLERIAALRMTLLEWAERVELDAIALQCWTALQGAFGIFPCFVHSLLTDAGVPVACETDINGALTSVMAQAAQHGTTPPFFADLTIRHPSNDNAELLWHCGPFPPSLAVEGKPKRVRAHFILPDAGYGLGEWEIKGGPITITRFDGDHGQYQLFIGHCEGTDGPFTRGTYVWVKMRNWPLWEERLIRGPYVHHVVGIHGHVGPALYEACRFLGITPDCVEPTEAEVQAYLRGE